MAGALALAWPLGPTGIALGVSIGCLGHAGAVVVGLARFGLWQPDRGSDGSPAADRGAILVMSFGLVAAMRLIPQDGALSLAALCARRPCALCACAPGDRRASPATIGLRSRKRMRTHENPCIVARPCHNARLNGPFSGEAASASLQARQSTISGAVSG